MDRNITISVEGACGIITLNRPRALNALNHDMVGDALDALHDWADDDGIRVVLIEGEGERGLCAGGDVRATRELALAGQPDTAVSFFADEYAMNALIATYRKPVVALQHGIIMGGGIGISSHARYRIATTDSAFAMPEAAIGFFCDVGVNAILYKTSEARALAFLLSGETVGVADAMALGLADAAIEPDALAGVRARIIEAAQAYDLDTALATVIQGAASQQGQSQLCTLADTLEDAFAGETVTAIIEALRDLADDGDPGAAALYGAIARHCPTSLVAILLSHRLARRQRDVDAILAADLAMAQYLALRGDFAEGVRAVLVDKDRMAKWNPARLADVDYAELERVLAGHQVAV